MSNTQESGLAAANQKRADNHKIRGLIGGVGFSFAGKRRGTSNVRATSRLAGDAELRKWRQQNVFSRVEKETKLQQIFVWADEHKVKGKPWGLLTPKDKAILQVLHDARCYATGRLDFAYSQICSMAKCCAQTVSAAIKKFQELGLIEKWRRMIPVYDPETGNSRNIQINNAYFLRLPAEVAKRVSAALEIVSSIVLPPVPPPREPTEHEVKAVAAARSHAAGPDREQAARLEHYTNGLVEGIHARRKAAHPS